MEEIRKDIFGVEIKVGDTAAFNPPKYKGLVTGTIVKFTPKGVRVKGSLFSSETVVFQVVKKN